MRIRSLAAAVAVTVLLGACAHGAARSGADSIAANEMPSRAERDEVDRWATRKRLCRELGVRFDSSGVCW